MNIAVYCGSSPQAPDDLKAAAYDLGTWIGHHGHTLVYGGSSIGLMGEVSRAVLAAGGCVHGVEPAFFIKAGVAQHDLTHLHTVDTMEERKALMIELADVFVALPGGVGTLEEISEIMGRIRLGLTEGPCYFLDVDGFYSGIGALLERMIGARFIERDVCCSQYVFAKSVEELVGLLDARSCAPVKKTKVPCVPASNLPCG